MKKIILSVKEHLRHHSRVGFWLCWFFFLAGSLIWNYRWASVHRPGLGEYLYLPGLASYALSFWGSLLLYFLFYGRPPKPFRPHFLLLSTLIFLVPFLNQFMPLYRLTHVWMPGPVLGFTWALGFNLQSCVFYFLIPGLYGLFVRPPSFRDFYGLGNFKINWKPYVMMLGLAFPLLLMASFRADFLRAYPRYEAGPAEDFWQVEPWMTILGYELSYILQFIGLELFFRGFVVRVLEPFMGKGSVFPMVSVYVYIHFLKPWPEAVSSLCGGYLLGVISLKSRSIWGGAFLHVGIALMMELLAYWHKYF